jgi:hypothetical protein
MFYSLSNCKTFQSVCKTFLAWTIRPLYIEALFTHATLGVLHQAKHALQFLHIPSTHQGDQLKLNLSHQKDLNGAMLKQIVLRWPRMIHLNLGWTKTNVKDLLEVFPQNNCLTELDLSVCTLCDTQLPQIFTHFPKLVTFKFSDTSITISGLASALPEFSSILSWHLQRYEFQSADLTTLISKCTQLTFLDLSATRATGKEIMDGLKTTCLKELRLEFCRHLQDPHLQAVVQKSLSLEKLSLKCTPIQGIGLTASQGFFHPSLRTLGLQECKNVNDTSLVSIISHSSRLHALSLDGLLITGKGLPEALARHRSVEVITGLSKCERVPKEIKEKVDAYLRAPSD